jgi:NADH dehydrogenase
MILVVGATGMLGGEVCRLLALDGQPVHAFVRPSSDPAKVQHLHDIGIPTVEGDVRDAKSIVPALKNVTEIITTVSSMPFSYVPGDNDIDHVDDQGMIHLIDAAKQARVRRFIYTSFSGHIDVQSPLRDAKRHVEEHLQNSGMHYTILRPSYFMEVWFSPAVGFDVEHTQAQIFGDGNNPISYISFKDVARFAVECLQNPVARDKILELGGPDALSQFDVVRIFEMEGELEFEITRVPTDALEQQRQQAHDPMQKSFSSLMLGAAHGDKIDMTKLQHDFPFHLTSVQEFAAQQVHH